MKNPFFRSKNLCLVFYCNALNTLLLCYFKVWLNRYSWGAGKQGSGYVSWFRRLECIGRRFLTMQFFVQIGLKMEPGDCPPLNINAMRAISVKPFLNWCHIQTEPPTCCEVMTPNCDRKVARVIHVESRWRISWHIDQYFCHCLWSCALQYCALQ